MPVDRYHRQTLLPGFGEAGQARLAGSRILLVGCGALGCAIADHLVRAGVGFLRIVDRDVVELTNLQRQVLYDEDDVAEGLPKAEAARRRLAAINHEVEIDAHVADFRAGIAPALARDVDLLLDGLDNFEARYLLNDLAVRLGRPYVYGGAVGTVGASFVVLPHPDRRDPRAAPSGIAWSAAKSTPCLRCLFPEAPPPGTAPTCETAGVLGPLVALVAAHQAAQALKLLTGNLGAVDRSLLSIDLWRNETRRFDVSGARDGGACPCCVEGRFEHLDAIDAGAVALCGRDAVQVSPPRPAPIDLDAVAARLAPHGALQRTPFLLRVAFAGESGPHGPIELTLFPDGRAIVKGVTAPDAARSIYARFVGG